MKNLVETGEPGVKPPACSSKLASRHFQVGISVLQQPRLNISMLNNVLVQ